MKSFFTVFVHHKMQIILIALLIILGVSIFSMQMNWGIRGKYYTNTNWEGTPKPYLVKRDDTVMLLDTKRIDFLPTEAFSVKWQGWLVIDEPGMYEFATKSDDGSFLSVDNRLVVDNGGNHGARRATGKIFLEKGSHRFEVLYFTIGGASLIETFWKPPRKREEQIPPESLFIKRPTGINILVRKGVRYVSSKVTMLLFMLGIALIFSLTLVLFRNIVRAKTMLFTGIMLAFVILSIECFAWIFFTIFQQQFTFFDAQQYLATEKQQEQMLNAQLSSDSFFAFGWDHKFSTPYGERPRKTSYGIPFISTFGDSFTYCDEVEHDESWQTYLSDLFKMDVYNFGVGGYGTDQAYLKYLSTYPKIPTPVVFLGLITENINRIVNVYRPFYYLQTAGRTAKPRFILKDGELMLLENPIRNKDDVKKLDDPQFIQRIGAHDWWYNRDNYPVLQFPYSKILLNKRMRLEIVYGRGHRTIDDMNPRPWENLWNSEEPRALMFKIFDAFVEDVKKNDAIPVILLLPMTTQVRLKFRAQQHETKVLTLLDYCERKHYTCFETITPIVESVTSEAEIDSLYKGHVSAKGNRIIAEAIFQFIQHEFPDIIRQYQHSERFNSEAMGREAG